MLSNTFWPPILRSFFSLPSVGFEPDHTRNVWCLTAGVYLMALDSILSLPALYHLQSFDPARQLSGYISYR